MPNFGNRGARRYRRKPAYRRKRVMKRTRARLALNVHRFKRKVVLGNLRHTTMVQRLMVPQRFHLNFPIFHSIRTLPVFLTSIN